MSEISLLNWLNAMILLPDNPQPGDYIALDHNGNHPNDFCKGEQAISWFCSKVIEADGNRYRVEYDDGARWYQFDDFDVPVPTDDGVTSIYPALPPLA